MKCCWKFVIGCRIVSGPNRGICDPQTVYMVGQDFVKCYEEASKHARSYVSDKANASVDTYLKYAEELAEGVHVL